MTHTYIVSIYLFTCLNLLDLCCLGKKRNMEHVMREISNPVTTYSRMKTIVSVLEILYNEVTLLTNKQGSAL